MQHRDEATRLESSRLANALLMLHARTCLVASELETMIRCGYADGAAARWRTLHEMAVTIAVASIQVRESKDMCAAGTGRASRIHLPRSDLDY